MSRRPSPDQDLVLTVASAWDRLEQQLAAGLSHIKGISFAEYRLLRSLADAPGGRASRVDLARVVGLSPSGVTRALRPLEKLGFVETHRSDRDARLALAGLTDAGRELVDDACGVIDDTAAQILERSPVASARRHELRALLGDLAGQGVRPISSMSE